VTPQTILISIMLANNEVGTLQPLTDIAAVARRAGVLLHTDAAQAIGKIPVNVDDVGVDLLSVAGHKFHAPPGVGALYIRRGTQLDSLIHGAGHEQDRRAGTEAVPAIVGLGVAAELAQKDLADAGAGRVCTLRDRFHDQLKETLGDRIVLNGHPDLRLPNTLNLGFVDRIGPDLLASMDNLAASSGAACHADRAEPSAVLQAMNVPRPIALGAVRFSLGRFNTSDQVDQATAQVTAAVNA
ncbi:MAG: cysteine desulfurase family protein, partial [Phycisphaerae bacterium]